MLAEERRNNFRALLDQQFASLTVGSYSVWGIIANESAGGFCLLTAARPPFALNANGILWPEGCEREPVRIANIQVAAQETRIGMIRSETATCFGRPVGRGRWIDNPYCRVGIAALALSAGMLVGLFIGD